MEVGCLFLRVSPLPDRLEGLMMRRWQVGYAADDACSQCRRMQGLHQDIMRSPILKAWPGVISSMCRRMHGMSHEHL